MFAINNNPHKEGYSSYSFLIDVRVMDIMISETQLALDM